MALGARRRDVARHMLVRALRIGAAGLLIGAGAAFVLAKSVSSFSGLLYGVRAGDPLTLAGVSALLLLILALASLVPIRRATRIDPMVALRHE